MNKISVKYLEKLDACEKSLVLFKYNFGTREYTINELLERIKENNIIPSYTDVSWLIRNCEFAQTQDMIDYYLSLKPDYEDVSWLIVFCKFAKTQQMIDYYLSLKPSYGDVRWLIEKCEFAWTNEKLQKYLEKIK